MSPRIPLPLSLLALFTLSCEASAPTKPPSDARAATARTPLAPLTLTPCVLPELKRPARCGTAHVFEDRALGQGRLVPLKVVVIPATQSPALPDPVVYIEGGPGGVATNAAADVVTDLVKTSATRDFVFVDQRGMGEGSPLRCKLIDGTDVGKLPSGELSEAKLRACLASMDANPALYTTSIAADDLDEVLRALGYAQANLLGVSYGTFASETFAHAHPDRVRTLVLNGVVNPAERFVLGFAPSSQEALEQTFAECAADTGCHAMHPDPRGELARAFARLQAHPEPLVATGPGGKQFPVTLDRNAFAMALRNPLYGAQSRGHALAMIHAVAEGSFDGLGSALLETAFGIGEELSVGAYLSIACTESLGGVTVADAERASAGTFLGTARVKPVLDACRYWPAGTAPSWLHDPVAGDMPALLFGGTVDPATPLAGLEKAKAKLKNAQEVIVPGAGHDVAGACADEIVSSFLDHPLAKVDTRCVKPIVTKFERPPIKLPTAALDKCAGHFVFSPDFAITVTRQGDTLLAQATGDADRVLDAESETTFRVRDLQATLEFEIGPDGHAKRALIHQGERTQSGERAK